MDRNPSGKEHEPGRKNPRDPAPATVRFVENAPFVPTGKGLQAVVELIAYPQGKVQVAVSRVSGQPGARKLTQSESLMFNDMNEAKDAVDALADRLVHEVGAKTFGPSRGL